MILVLSIALMAFYRLWLGGFFAPRTDQGGGFPSANLLTRCLALVDVVRLPIGVMLPAAIAWQSGADIVNAAFAGVFTLAVWRAYGHGPMLRYPLGEYHDDVLLTITQDLVPSDRPHTQYFTYAALRYTVPMALVAIWLKMGLGAEVKPWLIAGLLIPVAYFACARWLPGRVPFNHNYPAELAAGALMGAAVSSLWG